MPMAAEDFFLHGGSYTQVSETPRPKCCTTCAFHKVGPTVRPADVSVEQLEAWSQEYDDFVCHDPLPDGTHPRCAAWHALNRARF